MTKGEIAKEIFLSGKNCSQSVVLSFKQEMGLSEEQLEKLSIGFGGGIGRLRLTCGAVSGMVMVLSYLKSKNIDRSEIYPIIQSACKDVKEELGSLICAELLEGVKTDNSPIPEERTKEYYKKRPCAEICQVVADITQKYLNQ